MIFFALFFVSATIFRVFFIDAAPPMSADFWHEQPPTSFFFCLIFCLFFSPAPPYITPFFCHISLIFPSEFRICSILLHLLYLEWSLFSLEPTTNCVPSYLIFSVVPPLSSCLFSFRRDHPYIFACLFSSLLHGDQHHLMGNMFNLMIFGKMAEEDMGSFGKRALSIHRTTRDCRGYTEIAWC